MFITSIEEWIVGINFLNNIVANAKNGILMEGECIKKIIIGYCFNFCANQAQTNTKCDSTSCDVWKTCGQRFRI